MVRNIGIHGLALIVAVAAWSCAREDNGGAGADRAQGAVTSQGGDNAAIKADKGVDGAQKTIYIGLLNDESGPGASIGKPYAVGKRILAAQVNAGGSGLLPDGWKIELIERDHQYNPQKSVQEYNAIKNRVLFIGHSFGTPNTLPLRPMLTRDKLVAFPASLSSEMAKHAYTPPLSPSYRVEAMRALDWVVAQTDNPAAIKAGIVYQKDDYGKDGLEGWKAAADKLGVTIVSEQTVAPGQKDFTAVVTALKDAGADHVLLTTLASATGPIVGTAAQLQYKPTWLGNTPSWIDKFFDPEVLPPEVFDKFFLVGSAPYWGESLPGMDAFLRAYEAFGKDQHAPDIYILSSYVQGLVALEVFQRALESGDVTRAGYLKALQSLRNYTAEGLGQPIDLTTQPYMAGKKTRVLKPNFTARTWTQVAPFAAPSAMGN